MVSFDYLTVVSKAYYERVIALMDRAVNHACLYRASRSVMPKWTGKCVFFVLFRQSVTRSVFFYCCIFAVFLSAIRFSRNSFNRKDKVVTCV